MEKRGEIILYQPDSEVRLEVRLEDETVWLTQAQIVELFQSSKANISEHIKNIYEQGELDESSTVRDFRTVRQEGRRYVERVLTYYNLDAQQAQCRREGRYLHTDRQPPVAAGPAEAQQPIPAD